MKGIKITRAEDEPRPKNGKRGRLIIHMGDAASYHITRKEARGLRSQLSRFNLDK